MKQPSGKKMLSGLISFTLFAVSAADPGSSLPNGHVWGCLPGNVSNHLPFCNTKLSVADRLTDLLDRLTIDEMIGLICADNHTHVNSCNMVRRVASRRVCRSLPHIFAHGAFHRCRRAALDLAFHLTCISSRPTQLLPPRAWRPASALPTIRARRVLALPSTALSGVRASLCNPRPTSPASLNYPALYRDLGLAWLRFERPCNGRRDAGVQQSEVVQSDGRCTELPNRAERLRTQHEHRP